MPIAGPAGGRDGARRLLWVLLVAAIAAACSGGGSGGSGAVVATASAPSATPTAAPPLVSPSPAAPSAAPSVRPSLQPMPADPPTAMLAGSWDAPVAGALGTFTWNGLVSDAPWIVGDPIGDASSGPVTVSFDPGLGQATWLAQWAPVVDGAAGDAVPGGDGASGAIVIAPPGRPGDWSLQVTATFAAGYDATWFWRLEVAP